MEQVNCLTALENSNEAQKDLIEHSVAERLLVMVYSKKCKNKQKSDRDQEKRQQRADL